MTVGNIVDRARYRLGDSDKTGWSDATLIDLVDQAQQDISKSAQVYKRTAYLGLVNNRIFSPLPSDCFQVNRVEYKNAALAVLSREDQDVRASPKGLHIIKNDLDMSILEISEPFEDLSNYAKFEGGHHSVIDDVLVDVDALGVTTESSYAFSCSSPVGVVIDVEFVETNWNKFSTNFGDISSAIQLDEYQRNVGTNLGVMTELDFGYNEGGLYGFLTGVNDDFVEGTYGICTDALAVDNYLKLYYSALPRAVTTLYDALVISDMWARALVHYVVGMARQDDNDEGNYALGLQELKAYEKELKKAKKFASRSYNSPIGEVRQTTYRRI